MDVSPYLEVRPAPDAVLDASPARRAQVRFRVRKPDGAWSPVTYGDFAAQIRAVAHHLITVAHLTPGERVAVFGHNSVAWAATALGIQAAGGVMVPIYPASTAEQAGYVLAHAAARAVFVDGPLTVRVDTAIAASRATRASTSQRTPVVLDLAGEAWTALVDRHRALDAAQPHLVDERRRAIDLDAPGLMLYTSGTSGNPKGVPLTHRNVGVNGRDWLQCNAPRLQADARDLLWLPMSHIFGFGEMCSGNLLGWESWLTTPAEALALLPEVAPHVFMSVPAYWEKLARALIAQPGCGDEVAPGPARADARKAALARLTGGRLRFCLSGGAGLEVGIKHTLLEAGVLVIEGYGLTETSPTLTLNRPDAYRFDTVGKPVPSVELRLADDGEIEARGPNVFAGYHDDPVATAQAFTADGWFKTGDVGRWTEDGFLQIVDRKKDILVTAGGKNVPPANIEARFAGDPDIERVVVYGDARPYLVAAVWVAPTVPAAEREAIAAARVAAVNAGLASFETIKKFWLCDEPLTVEAGLLTASLKLRRKAVYARFRDRFEGLYA